MRLTETAVHRAPPSAAEDEIAITRREAFLTIAFGLALVWINAYICRELFWQPTAYMNSMHGFWIALAKRGSSSLYCSLT